MTFTWSRSTEIYNNPDNCAYPVVMFGTSVTGQFGSIPVFGGGFVPMPGFALGKFMSYDCKPYGVTSDANWIDLGGRHIITGAGELEISFRAPGSTVIVDTTNYQQQCLSALPAGGMRVVSYDTIPLVNGCFEAACVMRNYPDTGSPPNTSSPNGVEWHLILKKWGR